MKNKSAIVIGAGIVGMAMARALSIRGFHVKVFEKNEQQIGASIRNFGMIWPIGQTAGVLYERALRSRSIWKQCCDTASIWYEEAGSIHLAYNDLEQQVIHEIYDSYKRDRPIQWVDSKSMLSLSPAANSSGLLGGVYSRDEMIVEAREAIRKLPQLFNQEYNIEFYFGELVSSVEPNKISTPRGVHEADLICICTGSDFELLYPELYNINQITKCKLQMMRLGSSISESRMGPALCGGLSLIHYKAFKVAASLSKLNSHYQATLPEYLKHGIHVMVCQNAGGEFTIGDSHAYGAIHDPFDSSYINQLILSYLNTFFLHSKSPVLESWNGIYAKGTNGETEFVLEVEPGVWIVNALGGAGMTLSFGLAEEVTSGF